MIQTNCQMKYSLLVNLRENYRKNKEWHKSDLIRDKLLSLGWKIKDTPLGAKVTKI